MNPPIFGKFLNFSIALILLPKISKIFLWFCSIFKVGKSTLINEFLDLKDNKAPEGKTAIPQIIDDWPKKYPVNPGDTEIKGINIYDTEGIEKTKEGNNDINSHLDRIVTFISNPDTKLIILMMDIYFIYYIFGFFYNNIFSFW